MNDNIYIFKQGDYKVIGNMLMNKDSMACEDCLLGMYVWKDRYGLKLIKTNDSFFVYCSNFGTFTVPAPYLTESALEKMKSMTNEVTLVRVTDKNREDIERDFPDQFEFTEDTGSFDYIYDIEALATLKGKKLAKKRNHINGFLNTYSDWHIEEIGFDNLPKCRDFITMWYYEKIQREDETAIDSLLAEKNSLFNVIENYDSVKADGIALFVGNEIAAITIGQRISRHTYDVVFEKANEDIKGAYNMVNREFAKLINEKYPNVKYFNRENDLGIEGLRHAKMSYRPAIILKKYTAKYVAGK